MAQISPALDARPALQSAGRLVHEAVHRNRPLSREGLSERLFTLAFGGLVYPQIWEDPAVDLAAMEITPDHHVVTIASGGCNVLSYLTASPARITAVDLNRSHVALTRLKLAGIRHLPELGCILPLLRRGRRGRATSRAFRHYIAPHLDPETRDLLAGPRRWSAAGASRSSAPISTAAACSAASSAPATTWRRLYGVDLSDFVKARNVREQRAFFDSKIAPLFDKRLVRWLTRRPASLFGLGIPPAQYRRARADRRAATSLRCCGPGSSGSPAAFRFATIISPGRRSTAAMPQAASGPLPPYLAAATSIAASASARRRGSRCSASP